MASLNKLAIRGIRSFDDKSISVIEFFTPVTVIVGHNGSGKTTIIECLKYATTGDQPPNTRGGAFVHDPKMAAEKEVKAQVKLRFNAANGHRMIATRNLSVTTKKGSGLTMKTLESLLAMADTENSKGKRNAISTKCAEMDIEIPQLLGVSKSVLENVIFCHQEDSYWPLAEPSALKKKFDDIFEATRYTKALESIKSLRKDRAADLKAEKERLESLSREKGQMDKLKSRIDDLKTTIANKEVEYEEWKKKWQIIAENNSNFEQNATKFREIFQKVDALNEKIQTYEADVGESKLNVQEIQGSDKELQSRLDNASEIVASLRDQRRKENDKKSELEEELVGCREQHSELLQKQGSMKAEAEAQQQRIEDREKEIKDLCEKYGIRGFNYSPLDNRKVLEFMTKLEEMKKERTDETEKLQRESRTETEEYTAKARELGAVAAKHRAQKATLTEQMNERKSQISRAEKQLEDMVSVDAELQGLQSDIEEKRSRQSRMEKDIREAKYTERLTQVANKMKELEDRREDLEVEFRGLSAQADARAKLSHKRDEVKTKGNEIQHVLASANAKYGPLTGGKELEAKTIDKDVDGLLRQKENELEASDKATSSANHTVQQIEANLNAMMAQLKSKKDEMKAMNRELQGNDESLDTDTKSALVEVTRRKEQANQIIGGANIFNIFLQAGKRTRVCTACNRHLDDDAMEAFEEYLTERISQASPDKIQAEKEELEDWEIEYQRLRDLKPVQEKRDRLKETEIPTLQQDIKKQEERVSEATATADEATKNLEIIKSQMKDIQSLKQLANMVVSLQREIARAESDIKNLEAELSTSGSAKTISDLESDLEGVKKELQVCSRERTTLTNEQNRQNQALQNFKNDLFNMQIQERDLSAKLKDKQLAEANIESWSKDIAKYSQNIKETDVLLSQAQGPIEALESAHSERQREFSAKISQAQSRSQEVIISCDKIKSTNTRIDKYVREKRDDRLQQCNEKVVEVGHEIEQLSDRIEALRTAIAKIDKEISESGTTSANLRENLRIRKVEEEIRKAKAEVDKYDLEDAARAKAQFQAKFKGMKEEEHKLQTKYSHIGGEISSHKAQLQTWEGDFKEYKNTQKGYTEQLIKVKMSDMANNDLEKYAKALENAIMKYHTLKMEEVNDTMRHLWNKTYQGTDIDGIKIRSDVEGGASKRSYNYRVVMTKDQVEMDMRGRCSAGQKMLASIIIRLALSDSFGQNCGILALDEPTNALDTENIDALANSLVDIINERKNHANFQLIIITHDENFLRKLGQSEVMEHYWRVSRDARQKSVIERQRFR